MKYKNFEHYNIFYDNIENQEALSKEQCTFYEEKLGLVESHKKILSLLVLVDTICRKHGIKYSIADGTLLGAYRHKGFVPWDDDGDVMFTRNEYEKFINACKKEQSVVIYRYFYLDKFTSVELYNENICIDIFVCDVVPDSSKEFDNQMRKLKYMRYYLYPKLVLNQKGIWMKISFIFSFIIGKLYGRFYSDIDSKFDKIAKIGEKDPSDTLARFNASFHELKYRFDSSWFEEYIEIPFAHHNLMCIKGGEEFLFNMYGNYKILPPEEKREGTHETPYILDRNQKYFRFIVKPKSFPQ